MHSGGKGRMLWLFGGVIWSLQLAYTFQHRYKHLQYLNPAFQPGIQQLSVLYHTVVVNHNELPFEAVCGQSICCAIEPSPFVLSGFPNTGGIAKHLYQTFKGRNGAVS
ncbi:hypothetical protein EV426DRAFT_583597 [Tirmania nivea]|nr:hypothetical protein EV426DRAFT_583597 [Tirmania nivea]